MGYRKLTVDGKNYRYTIGKKFTKIIPEDGPKTILVENEKIGAMTTYEKCRHMVTPGSIAFYLQTGFQNIQEFAPDPYSEEIYGKIIFVDNDPEALRQSALDI